MTGLIRAELVKTTTVRSTWLVLGLVAVFSAATVAGTILTSGLADAPFVLSDADLQVQLLLPTEVSLFAALMGVVIATADLRHGTVVPAFLATPTRWPLVPAKAVITVLAAVALAVVATLTNAVVALPWLAALGEPYAFEAGTLATLACLSALNAALVSLIGFGVGALVRNQVAAVVGVVVVWFVLGPMLLGLVPDLGWYTPSGLEQVLTAGAGVLEAAGLAAPFGAWTAAALLGAYAAAATVAGGALLARRDV